MKYLIAVLLAAALALAGWASWEHQKALQAAIIIDRQAGTIRLQQEALDAQEQAAKRVERVAALTAQQHEQSMRRLRTSITAETDAIKQVPVWATTRVPDPIVDWLREH